MDGCKLKCYYPDYELDYNVAVHCVLLIFGNVTEIPKNITPDHFEDPVEELKVQNSKIQIIRKENFVNFKDCILLSLANNKIKIIEPNVFKGIINLDTLDMSNNLIPQIYNCSFSHLQNLHKLKLKIIN